jgi:putative transposase
LSKFPKKEESNNGSYNITISDEILHGFLSQNQGPAKLLEQVLNQILEAQLTDQLGAGRYERTEGRKGCRNGSYPRQLTTRVGRLALRVPRTRDGEFSTELFQLYQRSEQAPVPARMEMVVNGVPPRKITPLTKKFCGTSFSKSLSSYHCEKMLKRNAWLFFC